jgi:hypothetical protein
MDIICPTHDEVRPSRAGLEFGVMPHAPTSSPTTYTDERCSGRSEPSHSSIQTAEQLV